MSPKGVDVMANTENKMKLHKRPRKRQSTDNWQQPSATKKSKRNLKGTDSEILVIEDDSPINSNAQIDDDVVIVLNDKSDAIVLSGDSDDGETVKVIDTDSEEESSNIIINTSQTININNIVNKAICGTGNSSIPTNDNVTTLSHHNRSRPPYPKSWTKKMIKFYTVPCERSRNFDYKRILKGIKTKPSDWWIKPEDRFAPRKSVHQPKCRKCDKYGHRERECTKSFVCCICGESSHMSYNCPYSFCFTCGKPAVKSITSCDHCMKIFQEKKRCGLCGQLYHEDLMCPSKWRRHLILNSESQTLSLNPRKFCYNCAEQGHFGFECNLHPYSDYPPENPLKTSMCEQSAQSAVDIDNNVIFLSNTETDILTSEEGDQFFRSLCEALNTRIEFFRGVKDYIKIKGSESTAIIFKQKLEMMKTASQLK